MRTFLHGPFTFVHNNLYFLLLTLEKKTRFLWFLLCFEDTHQSTCYLLRSLWLEVKLLELCCCTVKCNSGSYFIIERHLGCGGHCSVRFPAQRKLMVWKIPPAFSESGSLVVWVSHDPAAPARFLPVLLRFFPSQLLLLFAKIIIMFRSFRYTAEEQIPVHLLQRKIPTPLWP